MKIMDNTELTQAIIALVLEKVNGYTQQEAELLSKEDNGELESKIFTILEKKGKGKYRFGHLAGNNGICFL